MSSESFKGILTASGREVSISDGVPSMSDIALSLSRQPRFGGHCRRWWTVLDHSLFVEELAEQHALGTGLDDRQARALRLAALLHDAHEALTADVPSPFKPATLKLRQISMDKRIFAAYYPGGYETFVAFQPIVAELDHRALLAEARVVGPSCLDTFNEVERYFGALPQLEDCCCLSEWDFSSPADLDKGIKSPSVSTFTSLYLSLR